MNSLDEKVVTNHSNPGEREHLIECINQNILKIDPMIGEIIKNISRIKGYESSMKRLDLDMYNSETLRLLNSLKAYNSTLKMLIEDYLHNNSSQK